MRKLPAFILLIPFAILFIGSVNVSSICPTSQDNVCAKAADQCCQKNGTCPKDKTAECQLSDHQAADHQKPGRQASDYPACCFSCPLCTLITVPNLIRFEPSTTEVTTEFTVRHDNRLTDYPQSHWKPPNAYSVS